MIASLRVLPHAVDTLVREHRRIETLLDVLERYSERLERGEELPQAHLGQLVAVFRGYADTYHHGKEEHVLFRAMIQAGLSEDEGPVAFMLEQHDEGRRLVGELAELAAAGTWTEADRARAARIARDYVIMLRAHIRDEDDVVYPLARARVRPGAWDDVERACADVDASSAGAVRELLARADELVALYP